MKIKKVESYLSIGGFTLVEMAIVLLIVGLLLSGGINLLSTTSENANYKQTQNTLQELKDTLVTYYALNKRLPCPDSVAPFDGKEDASCTTPASLRGYLPYATLGIGGSGDAWGERIKYVVSGDNANFFTTTATSCNYTRPGIASAVTVRIQDLNTAATNYVADYAAFVLVATAKNGKQTNSGMSGAFTDDGGCTAVATVNGIQLERENCNANSTMRSGNNMSDANSVAFDDLLVWEGDYQLISELRKVGVCN